MKIRMDELIQSIGTALDTVMTNYSLKDVPSPVNNE